MLTKYCSNVGHHSYVWEGVLIRLWDTVVLAHQEWGLKYDHT